MLQEIPAGFPEPSYKFQDNPLTKEGFELGRHLFWDGNLSSDGKVSCASCHQQFSAFTTYDHDRSHGVNNEHTLRNAPGIYNMAWFPAYSQDGAFQTMEAQILSHINASNEMNESIDHIISKLKTDPRYPDLFRNAFGDKSITSDRILKALVQFTAFITSGNSKYDRVKRGLENFTSFEQRGYTLFQQKCSTCHQEPFFTDFSYRNIGLAKNPFLNDLGRMFVTGNAADSLKFRVPSLRNVQYTAQYMHDGRLPSIQSCINHYRTGVQPGPTVDPLVAGGIALTNNDVVDLNEFLKALTDTTLVNDARYKSPN